MKTVRSYTQLAVCALFALLPSACTDVPAQTQPTQELGAGERSLISLVQRVSPAVVGVRTNSGAGSGVLIRADGLVLTNAHVVGNSRSVIVSLANGTESEGRVLGSARTVDIAVIDIEGSNLPTAPLGDSDGLQVGQSTIAIGNPIGLDRTVTTGVLSAMNRTLGFGYEELIQTDAAINPGNSGGPLLNSSGQVIGINTAAVRELPGQGPLAGLSFAIPINLARDIAQQLATEGLIRRAVIGIQHQEIDGAMARQFRLPVTQGLLVTLVGPNTPAAAAGIQRGDIITRMDNTPIRNSGDLRRFMRGRRPGDVVTIEVLRPQGTARVRVRLGEGVG
ncbi:MAG TPA: trypsin-like peptidase domain-containing protein [Longimicrobiales bacterium]